MKRLLHNLGLCPRQLAKSKLNAYGGGFELTVESEEK